MGWLGSFLLFVLCFGGEVPSMVFSFIWTTLGIVDVSLRPFFFFPPASQGGGGRASLIFPESSFPSGLLDGPPNFFSFPFVGCSSCCRAGFAQPSWDRVLVLPFLFPGWFPGGLTIFFRFPHVLSSPSSFFPTVIVPHFFWFLFLSWGSLFFPYTQFRFWFSFGGRSVSTSGYLLPVRTGPPSSVTLLNPGPGGGSLFSSSFKCCFFFFFVRR